MIHRKLQLAILTGVLVGIIDAVFGRGLLAISDFRTTHYLYLIPFLPFAGLLITWMYHHFSETSSKGITLVFETGQKKRDDIPLFLIVCIFAYLVNGDNSIYAAQEVRK